MKITINDKPAAITLDTEKTLGEVISGIELWISSIGSRMQKICVNGKEIKADALEEVFPIDVNEIEKLDILIIPWRELAAEALGNLYETCLVYSNAGFDERKSISLTWQDSSAARFLESDMPDIFNLACLCLSGEGLLPSDLIILLEERLNEIKDPVQTIENLENHVKIIAERMEVLPLDMQTGKDRKAAETVQLFSQIAEKLFRIFFIHRSEGLLLDSFTIDGLPAGSFIEELNTSLKELTSAYENNDTVLIGDISEYELAPRLLKFYSALKNITKWPSPVASGP